MIILHFLSLIYQSIYLNGTRIANATGWAVNQSFTFALNIGMYNDNSSLSLYGYVSNERFIINILIPKLIISHMFFSICV